MKTALIFGAAVLILLSVPVRAQWVKVSPAAVPRTPDGKPDLSAPAPRLPDGRPDLSGVWRSDNKSDLAVDLQPAGVPFQSWAKALSDERKGGARAYEDPPANCLPPGVPRISSTPLPWKIIQTPAVVTVMYEVFNMWRQIYLDGRELAKPEDLNPTWLGYSVGKWDSDTLVVETRGFNGKAWLDQQGKPTTD